MLLSRSHQRFADRPLQIDSHKSGLEIELNESLHRRRTELQAKIEALGDTQNGESSAADDLDSRVRELKSLKSSIQSMTNKSQGDVESTAFFMLCF